MTRILAALGLALMDNPAVAGGDDAPDTAAVLAQRFAGLALACVHTEYPNKIGHVLAGDDDVAPPRELTPVFFGCYDWHSSVHGHWLLARLARLYPEAEFEPAARAALARSFQADKVAQEVAYLTGPGRASFERPYGLAWLLQLAAELAQWDDPHAAQWSNTLEPLEREAARRIGDWLPKLTYAIRTGEHSQTAFAFGLILDWSRSRPDPAMERLLTGRIQALYLGDRDCPLAYEPSGQDFLSPCIAQADLVRRVLDRKAYEADAWLRSRGPEARASRRPQPEPRLDAGRHRGGAARGRPAPARNPRRVGRA